MFTVFQFVLIVIFIALFSFYRYVRYRGEKLEDTQQLSLLMKDLNQLNLDKGSANPEMKGSNAYETRDKNGNRLAYTLVTYPSTINRFGKSSIHIRELQNKDGTLTDKGKTFISCIAPCREYTNIRGVDYFKSNFE